MHEHKDLAAPLRPVGVVVVYLCGGVASDCSAWRLSGMVGRGNGGHRPNGAIPGSHRYRASIPEEGRLGKLSNVLKKAVTMGN